MQTYLVGGAVRDRLLGLPVRERDWVVVGATPGELEALGYRRVGASFPVYLHPETGEEYALARTERKTGPGLPRLRRDGRPDRHARGRPAASRPDHQRHGRGRRRPRSSIPTAARPTSRRGSLRHVSDAFSRRPGPHPARGALRRALRAPRLSVAPETLELMREMVAAGEAAALVPERVWQETEAALSEPRPDVFISVLRDCGALAVVFPEVDALWGVPQPEKWHPEIDTGVHLLLALQESARLSPKPEVRFAVLVHDLGKGTTPRDAWPKHVGHEERSVELAQALCRRLGAPNRFRELGCAVARYPRPVPSRARAAAGDAALHPGRGRCPAATGPVRGLSARLRGRLARATRPFGRAVSAGAAAARVAARRSGGERGRPRGDRTRRGSAG